MRERENANERKKWKSIKERKIRGKIKNNNVKIDTEKDHKK